MILTSEYQYIGRTTGVKAYGASYYYYILLYAKATASTETHSVSLKMRLACTADATFYGYATTGSAAVDGLSAISWDYDWNPSGAWPGSNLTEDGTTYPRWVDLAEGSVDIETGGSAKDVTVTAAWKRDAISTTPPSWLPSSTEVTASLAVTLPGAEPEPEPEPTPVEIPHTLVQVYADNVLAYDSRLEAYDLAGLSVTRGLNIGGTADIIMPMDHPAYNLFREYRTLVTIYRGGRLLFRGRPLYATDSIYFERTVTCEGEMCFLRDGITRPRLFKSTPAKSFRAVINEYNAQADDFKKFTIGEVTIPDSDIEMDITSAQTCLDSIDELLSLCGGYITFTTAKDGTRAINWLQTLDRRSNQTIELGENLLDFTRTGAETDGLATGIIPYGAVPEKSETQERITIASVNGGKDYILAEDAVSVRGVIMASQTWDEATTPAELLSLASAWLEEHKNFVTSLELTALDLSYLDKSLDAFDPGDLFRVISPPHGVNDDFQLTKLSEDLLDPARSSTTLGKEVQSLTGSAVAEIRKTHSEVASIGGAVKSMDPTVIASSVEQNVLAQTDGRYAPQEAVVRLEQTDTDLTARITAEEQNRSTADANLQTAINNEVNARAGIINKVDGTVHISGGAPVKILGGRVDIDGTELHFGKEARFLNGSGIRIADKDGNSYYVLRVDDANSCVVGNDYTNLYLRGKDAVYLYKTGAVVTSDRRHKNSIEELPAAYEAILDKLVPVRFKYNGRGDQYHVGFVAQDVDAALTEAGLSREDFGGFVDVSGNGTDLGIAYDEFIGLLLQKVRRLEQKITELEGKA